MKRSARDEAAKLFEEYVSKAPVVNKDAGHKKEKDRGTARGEEREFSVDLHGLNLEEAVRKADEVLRQARKNGITRVRIVTGIGKHSPGLYSPLYEGMEDHLAGMGGTAFTKKNGVFTVWIK